ncbi:MAG TPA: SpoIIE family protein phosphatase [Pyrinomonadaceae bacterium]|jgi:sigma-B regulation protein RsbU (phosphoserine phosphatase)|nr:SpoIIE family protein phosphatase [Pyrinomonadaceae bacterium]
MATVIDAALRGQLLERRVRLETAAADDGEAAQIRHLLEEVDAALARMEEHTFGLCQVCHTPVEAERIIADPLVCVCLGCLSTAQRRALEEDLELAANIQAGLLPPRSLAHDGWRVSYHYEAASLVSGDYCDVVRADDGSLYFMLGDVAGKGVAASLLMSQLHAMFRALIPVGLPLSHLVARASRIFCESTLPTHYATLVTGRADASGEVEICNAGHLPPLHLRREGRATLIEATGLPVGIFCNEEFTSAKFSMSPGDTLFLFTDGLSESRDTAGEEYGTERLMRLLCRHQELLPDELIRACLGDLSDFCAGTPKHDDLTVMALRRS